MCFWILHCTDCHGIVSADKMWNFWMKIYVFGFCLTPIASHLGFGVENVVPRNGFGTAHVVHLRICELTRCSRDRLVKNETERIKEKDKDKDMEERQRRRWNANSQWHFWMNFILFLCCVNGVHCKLRIWMRWEFGVENDLCVVNINEALVCL